MATFNKNFRTKQGITSEGNVDVTGELTATGNITGLYLRSSNSSGDEGGEILLYKPVTNTTIAGTGVTVDVFQNRLRFFEQGGTARGYYLDITAGGTNASTNLASAGGTTTNALTIGTGLSGTSFNGSAAVTIAIDSTVATLTGTQTLTNKTLTSPTMTTPSIGVATGTSFNSITGLASTTSPMDGTAAVGTGTTVARVDHVHPTDTSRAPLASPTFTGTPLSTTAAADTNTTQIATTAFVIGQASAVNPPALGSVAIGTSLRYARADHVHPTTGLGLTSGTLAQFASTTSSQLAGVISDETGSGALVFATSPTLTTPALGVATGTSFNSITGLSSTTPVVDGTAAVGTATTTARADHVHPTDTSRAPIASPTFTGSVTLPGNPSSSLQAATKQYVDDVAQGLHIHPSVVAATTANLTATYSNGTSGVGATLTNSGTLAAFSSDGVSPAQNSRVLVKNQTTQLQNGIYTLTTVGSGSVAWVLTRATDMDQSVEVQGGDFVFVTGGTANDNTGWVQTETGVTVGTNSIIFTQFSGAGTYLAGNGLTLTGNTFTINTAITADLSTAQTFTNKTINGSNNTITNISLTTGVTGTLPVANGGTGITSFGTGIATFLGTPSSANLAAAITDETGTGSLVFSASPTFTGTVNAAAITTTGAVSINTTGTGTINLGDGTITKASGGGFQFNSGAVFSQTLAASALAGSLLTSTVGTALGIAAAGTATVPARADHVHPTTGLGLTASGLNQFAATTSAQLAGVISDETGSGALVFATSPTLTTPNIGVATGTSFNSITGLSSTAPAALGTAAVGTGTTTARADHVHPTTGLALLAGSTFTGQIQSTLANSTTTGGGQIYLNGATGNRIDFNINGTAAPTFTTRSVGTKIVLYPLIAGSTVDYALGIEGSHMWSSVEQATSAYGFKWYGGTTNVMTLRGNGTLSLNSTSATLGDGSVAHQLGVVSGSATNIGLVVRAAASQSGDLQQWQSSAGTKLSYVDSAGKIFANGLRLDGSDGSNNNVYKTGTLGLLSGLGTQLYLNQDNNATGGSLIIRAVNAQTSNLTEWRNVAGSTVLASMSTTGAFSAVTKSFDIEHPTKENMRLRYGSLEGPENGVYVRGNTKNNIIELPDYWTGLVDESTITVTLTSIGKFQKVYLEKIQDNKVYIGGRVKEISYIIFGERKDVDKLTVEY